MTTIELPGSQECADTHLARASGTQPAPGHMMCDPHVEPARGTHSPDPAIERPQRQVCSAGSDSASTSSQAASDAQCSAAAGGPDLPAAQKNGDDHAVPGGGDLISDNSQQESEAQSSFAVVGSVSARAGTNSEARPNSTLSRPGGFLRDPMLGLLAEVVDDLESVRIANDNRVRILTRADADADGEDRGFGLTPEHPEVAKLIATIGVLKAGEDDAIKNLEHAMKRHPLGAFVKATSGLGWKQTARLLAAIGDPYWNDLHDRPRTVSELWAYCGFHVIQTSGSSHTSSGDHSPSAAAGSDRHPDHHCRCDSQTGPVVGVAPKRTRGRKSNWSETARKRVWVIASAVPKFKTSPYEPVYRAARAKYLDTVHPAPCVRCGPAGKPAPAGSPRSPGHQNAMAIRIVAKEILKDLWLQSKTIYESEAA